MKFKTKGIIKKIALVFAGVAAITAMAFGVKVIVDYTKNDLTRILPSFEVGNLGADGKYVADESMLYTKEAFGCYGLQIKPDFDSTVNYRIYYYDILDNFISVTETMLDGFGGEAPLNGAYARIVIEPRDDEDGKISWTEKVKYPAQLTVKVKKEQNINERFCVFSGRVLQVVNDTTRLIFSKDVSIRTEPLCFVENSKYYTTTSTLLNVVGGSTISADFGAHFGSNFYNSDIWVYEFRGLPSSETYISNYNMSEHDEASSYVLSKQTKYILITVHTNADYNTWTDEQLSKLPLAFTVAKTK